MSRLTANVAADNADTRGQLVAQHLALGNPVPDEAHDVGAEIEETPNEPSADEAGGSRHERRTVAPELPVSAIAVRWRDHFQTFHGARRSAHSVSRKRMSRTVSIGCQNPSWRYARSSPAAASASSGPRSQSVSSDRM